MVYDCVVVQPLKTERLEDNSEGEVDGESDGELNGEEMMIDELERDI